MTLRPLERKFLEIRIFESDPLYKVQEPRERAGSVPQLSVPLSPPCSKGGVIKAGIVMYSVGKHFTSGAAEWAACKRLETHCGFCCFVFFISVCWLRQTALPAHTCDWGTEEKNKKQISPVHWKYFGEKREQSWYELINGIMFSFPAKAIIHTNTKTNNSPSLKHVCNRAWPNYQERLPKQTQ